MANLFKVLGDAADKAAALPHFKECRWCGCNYGEHQTYEGDPVRHTSVLPFCSRKCEAEAIAFYGKQKEANKNQPKSGKECKICGTEPVGDHKYCPNCGCPFSKEAWDCRCGFSPVTGDFCPSCGGRFDSPRRQ